MADATWLRGLVVMIAFIVIALCIMSVDFDRHPLTALPKTSLDAGLVDPTAYQYGTSMILCVGILFVALIWLWLSMPRTWRFDTLFLATIALIVGAIYLIYGNESLELGGLLAYFSAFALIYIVGYCFKEIRDWHESMSPPWSERYTDYIMLAIVGISAMTFFILDTVIDDHIKQKRGVNITLKAEPKTTREVGTQT